jgi:sugar diacid utilization regulator
VENEERKLILAYAKNNMNAKATARELYYHPNTVYKYFIKMKGKYRLNPCVFYDLVKLIEMAYNEIKGGANV